MIFVSICSGILLIIVLQFLTGCAVEQPEVDNPPPLPYIERSYNDFDPNIDLPQKPKDKKSNKHLKSIKR